MLTLFFVRVQKGEAGVIQGQIVDRFDLPVPNVTVKLYSHFPHCLFAQATQKTATDGSFSFQIPSCPVNPDGSRPFILTILPKKGYVVFPKERKDSIKADQTLSRLDFERVQTADISQITRLNKTSQICSMYSNSERIPLILIHGIKATNPEQSLRQDNNTWDTFLDFFSSSPLCPFFEPFSFQYYSNYASVKNIAGGLKFWLDREKIQDKQKVLLAHSMGGLVGWSYLNEWEGDLMTLRLLALATPFHGTPAANGNARNNQIDTISGISPAVRNGLLKLLHIADSSFWDGRPPNRANRSDLRFDNYNCTLLRYKGRERNDWLRKLNNVTSCSPSAESIPAAAKIRAYAGYINPTGDPDRPSDYTDMLLKLIKLGPAAGFNHPTLALTNFVLMTPLNLSNNDGIVPTDSAWFDGHVLPKNRRIFQNCDHIEMTSNANGVRGGKEICRDDQGLSVFERLEEDLEELIGNYSPTIWPMFGRNAQHTGRSPYVGAQEATLKWTFGTDWTLYRASPVIGSDGTVYMPSGIGSGLYAIKQDGTQKWKSGPTKTSGDASAAIGQNGDIYTAYCEGGATETCGVAALNNSDGSFKWKYPTGSLPFLSVGPDETIYAHGYYGPDLYAINQDGSRKWSYNTGISSFFSSPVVSPDGATIYAKGQNGLLALDSDGSFKWKLEIPECRNSELTSGPTVGGDGTIYIGFRLDCNSFYAVNPDGSVKWRYGGIGSYGASYSSPAIGSDGTIYVGGYDFKLHAINPDGSSKWTFLTGDQIESSPTIGADGTIYFGSNDNYVYTINSDGMLKWKFNTGDDVWSSPTIDQDGTVYIASQSGAVYAFKGPAQ